MKSTLLLFAAVLCSVSISFSQTWTAQTSGTTNTIRDVFFINATTGWAVGANGTIIKTTDGGAHWLDQSTPSEGLFIGCYFFNETTGYVGGDHGMRKTTDGGKTWSFVIGTNNVYPDGITKIFFLDALHGWAVGGADGSSLYGDIYSTTDGGVTWKRKVNGTDWARFYGVQFVNANTGWVYSEVKSMVLKTTDGGTNWTVQISAGDTLSIGGMYFTDANTGWVVGRTATAGVVLKTTDGGTTWKKCGGNLAYALTTPHFFDANNGWAGGANRAGEQGALRTADGGVTWTPYMFTGKPALEGAAFFSTPAGWAYGDNGTLMKLDIPTVIGECETGLPNTFSLGQNYPNPFNPSTNISFSIPVSGFTTLKVYDVLGNEAATLISRTMTAGSHSVTFNASRLASGVYFYRLQAGAFSATKKLMLTK